MSMNLPPIPTAWLEVVAAEDRPIPPGSRRVMERWSETGRAIRSETVIGEPFWSYQETTTVPALVARTVADRVRRMTKPVSATAVAMTYRV